MNSSEIRADGWQRDVGDRNRTVSTLAGEVRALKAQQAELRERTRVWRDEADACISIPMATALRGCADQVDAVITTEEKVPGA